MSGGSYDYLCFNTDDLSSRYYLVERMRDRLAELGHHDMATQTQQVLNHLDAAREQADVLSEVWRAVEWHDSNDCSVDQVTEAVEEHRAKTSANHGEADHASPTRDEE